MIWCSAAHRALADQHEVAVPAVAAMAVADRHRHEAGVARAARRGRAAPARSPKRLSASCSAMTSAPISPITAMIRLGVEPAVAAHALVDVVGGEERDAAPPSAIECSDMPSPTSGRIRRAKSTSAGPGFREIPAARGPSNGAEAAVAQERRARAWKPGTAATAGMSTATAILVMIIIGAIAGWLAGVIVKGGGYGLVGDIIVGIIGA